MSFIIVMSCISLTLRIFYVLIAYCLFIYVPWKNICSYQFSSYRLGHLSFYCWLISFFFSKFLDTSFFINYIFCKYFLPFSELSFTPYMELSLKHKSLLFWYYPAELFSVLLVFVKSKKGYLTQNQKLIFFLM